MSQLILKILDRQALPRRSSLISHDQTPFQVSTMNLSSTLVETVSIDYEDFNESFLTCGTCLNTFDSSLQTPKLLPCSHTICLECLTRIVATFARDSQFRCPICRWDYCTHTFPNNS